MTGDWNDIDAKNFSDRFDKYADQGLFLMKKKGRRY